MSVLRLLPAYKDYLWGGDRLVSLYGKIGAPSPLAETWEVSLHPDGPTTVEDGRLLSDVLTLDLLGENCASFPDFPLLVKLIDAAQDLSLQVHPTDAYALVNENSYGKTEMWYIVDAEAGAGIYLGFCRDVTEEEARAALDNGTFTDLLRFVPVKRGDCYVIPAGTVHAIGAGCLVCEVQQNSNLTYRIYDYGRRDAKGNLRPLHKDKAFSVMNLFPCSSGFRFLPVEGEETLGCSRYFHTARICVTGERVVFADAASFRALICTSGKGTIDGSSLSQGDSLLIPAGETARVIGDMTLISVSVRRYTLKCEGGHYTLSDDLGRVHAIADEINNREDFLACYGLTTADVEIFEN